MPRHDITVGVRRESAFENLIPADELAALGVEELLDALDEISLQRVFVLHAELLHARLDPGRRLPLIFHRLIATDVDVFARKELHDFGEHVLEEREGGVIDVEQRGKMPQSSGTAVGGLSVTPSSRVGDHRGGRVTGHLDLGKHGDVARSRRAQRCRAPDPACRNRRSSRGLPVAGSMSARAAAPAGTRHAPTDRQLRILLDLQPPRLVVGEMPVKDIELVQRHPVDELLDVLRRLIVTRGIEHESAPDGSAARRRS